MAVKQTAGRTQLGEFAPKFAELNDDVLFGEVWAGEETGLLLALFLIAGQFFVEGASVQAAGKQKALNITDLSLSVGQSQKLKVLNGKKVRWSSSKKNSGKRQQKRKKTIRPEIIRMKPNSRPKQKNRW